MQKIGWHAITYKAKIEVITNTICDE